MPDVTPNPRSISQGRYPSPAQIEAYEGEEINFPEDLISTVLEWKHKVWYPFKKSGVFGRLFALSVLIDTFNEYYDKEVVLDVGPDCYQPDRNRILLVSPSVITAMHEFAHALFGEDELVACAYAVHLFKKTFPIAWKQLEWDGHVLRRVEIPSGQTAEDVAGMEPDDDKEVHNNE